MSHRIRLSNDEIIRILKPLGKQIKEMVKTDQDRRELRYCYNLFHRLHRAITLGHAGRGSDVGWDLTWDSEWARRKLKVLPEIIDRDLQQVLGSKKDVS